jgi:hypothetical protein
VHSLALWRVDPIARRLRTAIAVWHVVCYAEIQRLVMKDTVKHETAHRNPQ